MPHFRVDDALHSHPKAQRAGDEALGMWARAGSFCMAYLTDGFVPEWWVKGQYKGTFKAKKLVVAGLWNAGENDGERGFWFHEFVGPGRQDSRAQIESDREKWRKKKRGQRAESPPVSPEDNHRDTIGDTPQETRESPGYTQPNPTQPIKNSGCEPSKSPVSRSTNARGTRLPDGWDPPDSVIAQMRSDHPQIDLRAEHAKFTDHWRGKAGRDGRKADWPATWRNWIRRAAEQQPATRNGRHGPPVSTSDLRVQQTQALKAVPSQRLEQLP